MHESTLWTSTVPFEHLLYEIAGPLVRISFNRPAVRNAQSRQLLEELDVALRTAEADDSLRVVILAGVGDHFSAGHDLKNARAERPSPTVEERWLYEEEHFYEYCLRLHDLRKPTIAQVQGACIEALRDFVPPIPLVSGVQDTFVFLQAIDRRTNSPGDAFPRAV